MAETYLPPELIARLDQLEPELRYLARALGIFYEEMTEGEYHIPEDLAGEMSHHLLDLIAEGSREEADE